MTAGAADPFESVHAARDLRERILRDPHRPRWHFTVPEGHAMPFDPNGAIYWRGRYHLFYILQDPRGHCWGHASSGDLVHWVHHPTALAPNPGDIDRGIFSGNAFVNLKGAPTILYHGVNAGNCIATSADPDLIRWTKSPTNPIVRSPREGDECLGLYESWDPHGWTQDGRYYAIFGGRPATLFESDDMVRWRYLRPVLPPGAVPGESVDEDEDLSCPDLFTLGGKHVLVCISHKRGLRYYVGSFADGAFRPESHQRMNWEGGTCFAPESLLDDHGRRIMWAWVLDRRPGDMVRAAGACGEMTLPRVLSMRGDGLLGVEPAPEFNVLRRDPRRRADLSLPQGGDMPLEGIAGDSLELDLELDPGGARQVGLKVRCSPGAEEQTEIHYDREAQRLRVDFGGSSLNPRIGHTRLVMARGADDGPATRQEAPLSLAPGEPLRLRVFIDRSMLEVYANGRQCVTQRIYPARPDSLGVRLLARGGPAWVRSLWAWTMADANAW